MNDLLIFLLFVVLIASAIAALKVRDLLAAVFCLTAFSFGAALVYALMGATDVAFTEAVVGAGVSGVFIIVALFFVDRRSKD
ncbi:MAG TPA: hydrogenase subunit MbhD domain-containing protein [Dehalococcoidales bacterium]|nr:hydrogenase subunit MbhD domain-containing protein [Dehalococcoidales bacterium]